MKKINFKEWYINKKFPLPIEFFKWVLIDIVRKIKNPPSLHLFGIYGFVGLPGKGKTMALVKQLDDLREKHGDKFYITTNFHYAGEDFPFESWTQLLEEYDKPLVVGWDEVQNQFTSRDFKSFPIQLLGLLTQVRKGHGIRIYWTAQRWARVDKVFRELTERVGDCRTLLGRLTRIRFYHWEDYEMLHANTDINKKMRIRPIKKLTFVQDDKIRDRYNSYKMLESAKKMQYMDRKEMKEITGD